MDVPSSCMVLCSASSHRANISACRPSAAPKARGEIPSELVRVPE